MLAALRAAHAEGRNDAGLDVGTGKPRDLSADGIVDLYQTKWWALRLAVDAAVTVLKVDQIIMVRGCNEFHMAFRALVHTSLCDSHFRRSSAHGSTVRECSH